MNNISFDIKITGGGNKDHIIHSLYDLAHYLEETDIDESMFEYKSEVCLFEDPVLCAEIIY